MSRCSVVIMLALWLAWFAAPAAAAPSYMGTQGCKCHKSEVEDWLKSPHAKAFEALSKDRRSKGQNKALRAAGLDHNKDYSSDEKCVGCHTVGFGKPGGFAAGSADENFKGVGCEMCHGPGSEYRVLHKEKDETFTRAEAAAVGEIYPPKEDTCRQCHDHKDSPFNAKTDAKYMFNFDEMIKLSKAWHKKHDLQFKH